MKRRALFVDRDGVICRMVKYDYGWDSAQSPVDVELVKGIVELIKFANKKRLVVVEISNQPGVAKGKMTQEISDEIEARVHHLLSEQGAAVDSVYICNHHPKGVVPELTCDCACRKPKPGLLLKAAKELSIDLGKSFFLGDKATDVEAGRAAGCKTILYLHEEDSEEKVKDAKSANADIVSSNLERFGEIFK